MTKVHVAEILRTLSRLYPRGEKPWTTKSNPFRTIIGTIMSAQTTDAQVDGVTPELFRRYPTPAKLAQAKLRDVERIIKPVGLHKSKAKNIIAASRMIANDFGGRVPGTRDEMVKLPGVGRKTANVVLIKAFNSQAMPVDTHVFRVSTRIGFAKPHVASNARKASNASNVKLTPIMVEEQLVKIIPKSKLGAAHFWLIHHGRTLCAARSPKCGECPIAKWCEYAKKATPRKQRQQR